MRFPLPMNLAPTNPPLTPPRRATGQPVLLPSWEGLGVGSGALCAHKIRGSLSSVLSPLLRRGEKKQKRAPNKWRRLRKLLCIVERMTTNH